MDQRIPEVGDFEVTGDTPMCPKCGGPMDQGKLHLDGAPGLGYLPSTLPPSISPKDVAPFRAAHSCIACGYTELYTDPAEVRCILAGIRPQVRV
jgi:predicted nucleic-acid-binding Zn-ribbon protein